MLPGLPLGFLSHKESISKGALNNYKKLVTLHPLKDNTGYQWK